METIFMKTKNSKTYGPHKFVFNLPQRLDLRSSNKQVAIYYTSTLNKYRLLYVEKYKKAL